MVTLKSLILSSLLIIVPVYSRIHKLYLADDQRHYIDLTTFGFYRGGVLYVKLKDFKLPSEEINGVYGFTLDRTANDAVSPYLPSKVDSCFLNENYKPAMSPLHPGVVFLKMDFQQMRLAVKCSGDVKPKLFLNQDTLNEREKRQASDTSKNNVDVQSSLKNYNESNEAVSCSDTFLPINKEQKNGFNYYSTSFGMRIDSEKEEGLYNLYFHNCPNKEDGPTISFLIEIFEKNQDNFLSAGEMPLPVLYTCMSLIFLLSAIFWTYILKTSRHRVYRIHIVMCVLVYLKSLSLAFHGINYHFIQTKGEHVTAWAVLFYLTHLLKGAVLFVTIVLVGTGWNFIKHILADRDKKLFMIVIPLQVVANVAEIIIEESEEGAVEYNAWRHIFIVVDLLCCGAIIFPVVWSIRHLQDASTTDGKAAINLKKLKLFRHFYIMVPCYIYFTRIIAYLLKITVSFRYSWIDELFREMTTYVFFVMTGYKFRPAAANPYFTPTQYDDDAQVISEIGVLEGVTKVGSRNERRERKREDMEPLMSEEMNYNSD